MFSRSVNSINCKLKLFNLWKFFSVLLLLLFLCADNFNSEVFAAKKKSGKKGNGKSSRRSAGSSKKSKKSGKSSRRSASSSKRSSRRSASSSSRSSRRSAGSSRRSAGSRTSRRRSVFGSATRGISSNTSKNASSDLVDKKDDTVVETYGLNPCPVDFALWQKPEEEREGVYYKSKKTACYSPKNTESNDWKKGVKDSGGNEIEKAPWIADDEAVVLSCGTGFFKSIKGKQSFCVEDSSFCPLSKQVVERKGKSYINAATEEECNVPSNAVPLKLTKGEIELSGFELKVGKAYYMQCKEGFYAEENGARCKKCKKFYTSDKGSVGEIACHPAVKCNAGFKMSDVTGECEKTKAQKLIEKRLECKAASKPFDEKKEDCGETCKTGWFVNAKFICEITAEQLEKDTIEKCYKRGQSYDYTSKDCKPCDVENNILKSNGQCIPMTTSYCSMTAPCPAGSYGTGCGKCKPCPEGTYTSSSGNLTCTPCLAGTYAAGTGNRYCSSCSEGSYAKERGSASCKICSCQDSNSGIYSSNCTSDGLKTRVWGVAGYSSLMVDLNVRRYCSGYHGFEGCDINPSSWSADIKKGHYFKLRCKRETGKIYLDYD